jgi:hypothetical protein
MISCSAEGAEGGGGVGAAMRMAEDSERGAPGKRKKRKEMWKRSGALSESARGVGHRELMPHKRRERGGQAVWRVCAAFEEELRRGDGHGTEGVERFL